jgi:DNA polymerase-4
MDAFYASVEQRDHPHLRGRPVVVGGSPEGRGVVAAASYEARKYGIHSAMPAGRAARLCRDLVFVRPDFMKYREVSIQLRAIFEDYSDHIEPLSLDEAFLDVTENKAGLPTATAVAKEIRRRVREELRLTCSAGVSSLKFVAKIASDHRKPDGLTVVPPGQVLAFIHPLPVRKLPGVGPATEKRLQEIGIFTVGDLAAVPAPDVHRRFGKHGAYLWRMAQGEDPRRVQSSRPRRSQSAERTFAEDIEDRRELEQVLADQAERVCRGLEGAGLRGRTVTLKVRYGDFTTITRSETLEQPTNDPFRVAEVARALLDKTEAGVRPVRLVGVGVANLLGREETPQLELPLEYED